METEVRCWLVEQKDPIILGKLRIFLAWILGYTIWGISLTSWTWAIHLKTWIALRVQSLECLTIQTAKEAWVYSTQTSLTSCQRMKQRSPTKTQYLISCHLVPTSFKSAKDKLPQSVDPTKWTQTARLTWDSTSTHSCTITKLKRTQLVWVRQPAEFNLKPNCSCPLKSETLSHSLSFPILLII